MKYALLSDIHGNLEALLAAMDSIAREGVDRVLCVGDIVGYGANPSECIRKVQELCIPAVIGNHDAASAGKMSTFDFSNVAREAVLWTGKNLTEEDRSFLRGLGAVYKNEDLTIVHGTLFQPEEFHYMFDKNSARVSFDLMETDICFVGHTHVPGMFLKGADTLTYFYKEKLKFNKTEKMIVNVGSVGQSRDGDPRLCYCIYDSEKRFIELKRVKYDINKAQEKILKAALPASLAYRLSDGT